jgi:hypothetical protein
MRVKTLICLPYQFAVETLLTAARFVSRYKQNRHTPAIKGKGYSPFTICRTRFSPSEACARWWARQKKICFLVFSSARLLNLISFAASSRPLYTEIAKHKNRNAHHYKHGR